MDSFPMVSPFSMTMMTTNMSPQTQQAVPWMFTIPSNIPWSPANYNDSVVTFTAKSAESSAAMPQQFKRKGAHLDSACPPSKLYISEEKMVARMKELNISNCESKVNECESLASCPEMALDEVETKLGVDCELDQVLAQSSSKEPVLVLSQELKDNMSTSDPILPLTIVEKLQKPSMEIVLWKPPGGIVSNLIKAVAGNKISGNMNNNSMDDEPMIQEKKKVAQTCPSPFVQPYLSAANHPTTENKLEHMEL